MDETPLTPPRQPRRWIGPILSGLMLFASALCALGFYYVVGGGCFEARSGYCAEISFLIFLVPTILIGMITALMAVFHRDALSLAVRLIVFVPFALMIIGFGWLFMS